MDRKQDASKDLLNEVTILIENNKILELRELLEEYHIIDIFEIMENLEENEKIKLFEVLPLDMAASILEESDVEFFSNILSKLDTENKKNILELMSLDDMADILSQLEEDERENIMELLSEKDADDVKELLIYEEESTGGIMTTGYIQINEYMTAKEAISHMREYAEDAETIYYVYVVDNEERLVGVLSLRELILARDSSIVKDLMSENIISVFVDEDREEAVRLVSKYNLIAIPVIDREHRLKGIITVDDIIDVMEEEATEDMYKFAGTSEHEIDIAQNVNKTATEQIFSSVRARIPWLIITLLAGLLSSAILSNLDFIMNPKYASLVFFIPVVLGMGGNIGTQSSALAVMSLSNKDLEFNNVIREAVVGIITGIICSLIVSIIVFIFIKDTNDFYLYILINVITSLVGNIVLVNSLKQYVSTPNVNKERVRYHLSKSWKFLIPQFSILIYTSLDKVILGNLANMTEVAYYDQSQKIIRIAVSLVSSVGVALLPRMTYLAQNNKKEEFDNLLTKSLNNVLLVSIYIVTVIICVSPNFVDWFFSKEYRNMALLMQIVSPIGVFIPIATILWNTVLIPNKLDNIAIKSAIYCAIMSVILNTLLDKNLGALGAIITLLVVEFYGMSYRIYHSRKYYNFKILIPSLCKYLGAGIFSYICVILFTGFMKSSIISTVIIGIISTIVYFLILIAMKDKLLLSYLEKVKMRLKRGELNDKKII